MGWVGGLLFFLVPCWDPRVGRRRAAVMLYEPRNDGVDPCTPGIPAGRWMSWQWRKPGIRSDDDCALDWCTCFGEEEGSAPMTQVTLTSPVAVRRTSGAFKGSPR